MHVDSEVRFSRPLSPNQSLQPTGHSLRSRPAAELWTISADEHVGHLARIIHQPEKSTREGPFGGQMILNTIVFQDHHDPKASSSDGLGSLRIGLSVAIRRTSL